MAGLQEKERKYLRAQELSAPSENRRLYNYILQRTLAHPEIPGNGQWILNTECYICGGWEYSQVCTQVKGETAPSLRMNSTVCMLNNADMDKVELVDVRQFAKRLIERGENKSDDFSAFLQALPDKLRRELIVGPHFSIVKK